MVHTPEAVARQEERTERRRQQVLDAAEACFVNEGFHSASINRIAVSAGMSAGHIYKLFENKEAIIAALCETAFSEMALRIAPPEAGQSQTLAEFLAQASDNFVWFLEEGRASLWLEVMAEARRNCGLADMLAKFEGRFRDSVRQSITPFSEGLSGADIDSRVEHIHAMLNGLTMRVALHPAARSILKVSDFERCLLALLTSER